MDLCVRQIVLSDVALRHKAHDCLRFSHHKQPAAWFVSGAPGWCRVTPCQGCFREKSMQKYKFIFNYANFDKGKTLFCAIICTFHLFLVSLHVKKAYNRQ